MRNQGRFHRLAAAVTVALASACGASPAPDSAFPPARPAAFPREPSSRDLAWKRCREQLTTLEAKALLVHAFGCARCTRFTSAALVLHDDARFWIIDRVTATILARGVAPLQTRDTVREILASEAWRDVDPGSRVGERSGPWDFYVGGGKTVTILTWGSVPAIPRAVKALDAALRPLHEAPATAMSQLDELRDCVAEAPAVNHSSRRTP